MISFFRHILFCFFILPALSGCARFIDSAPPPSIYLIHAQKPEEASVQKTKPVSIIVDRPKLIEGLNTDRIALLKNNMRNLDYFAQARWNGPLDAILQDFIMQTLEQRYNISFITDSAIDNRAHYKIISQVRAFQAEYNGNDTQSPPLLRASISLSVVRLKNNTIIYHSLLEETRPAQSNSLSDITSGLEDLVNLMLIRFTNDFKP